MSYPTSTVAVKTLQGVGSKTWAPPPLHGPLTVPEVFAHHAEHSPEHPVFAYDDSDNQKVKTIKHKDVFPAIRRAAKIVSGYLPSPSTIACDEDSSVISILAITDSITYVTLLVGIMYLGRTPFALSSRNSPDAVADLMLQTASRHLLVSPDAAMQHIAREAMEILRAKDYDVQLHPLPEFVDLYNPGKVTDDAGDDDVPVMANVNRDEVALVVHSSGSTSHPKPIKISHRNFVAWGFAPYYGDVDLCAMLASIHILPMFHSGGCFLVAWMMCTGVTLAVFCPSSPPAAITPENVMRALHNVQCDAILSVPAFIEAWSRDDRALETLKSMKFINYGGAMLSEEVGQLLAEEGVCIYPAYGQTETGAISYQQSNTRPQHPQDWEYFALTPVVEYVRRYHKDHPDLFEIIVLDGPLWAPNAFNIDVDGRRGYAMNDFLVAHPTDPNLMKVFGRVDDQIVLSTGEKTNPVPMEAILLKDVAIRSAIVFGHGRLQNGVIIEPVETVDPSNEQDLAQFRERIWPTVERANAFAPAHSRIFKEMITVTNPSKPFQYTAKGTPRRQVSLNEYAEEIDDLYRRFEESSQSGVPIPSTWNEETVQTYVRAVVQRVMKVQVVNNHDDLFQQGCDSLQAAWIRNNILHALRTTTRLSVHTVPLNFVYTHPTIAQLGVFVFRTARGLGGTDALADPIVQMNAMVEKYSAGFSVPRWGDSASNGATGQETILITGTTGHLGSHLLRLLLQRPEVVHVYALNRKAGNSLSSQTMQERQREAFRSGGFDEALLSTGKVSFHVCDLTAPSLGLDEVTLEEIRGSVTAILHNAWRVDFQVSLASFEPLIAGARNLLDLALSSTVPGGPHVLFVSSISSVLRHGARTVLESLEFGPEVAIGSGYGESKWVTEQIFARAAAETGLRTTSVRVGQLSGDSRFGTWNTKEWVPTLVRASKKLRCVPGRDNTTISWLPIDTAASALTEMLYSDKPILHISSPRPILWNEIFGPIAEQLGAPLVSPEIWLQRLGESAPKPRLVPEADKHDAAHTLIEFFEVMMKTGDVPCSTEKSMQAAESLGQLKPLSRNDALRWLSYWETVGFMDS